MSKPVPPAEPPMAADLYGEMYLAEVEGRAADRFALRDYLPGLGIVAIAAGAAAWLSDHYGLPVILAGLLIGLALNFVSADDRTRAGFDLCSTQFLRIGIVLLGTQITIWQITALGGAPFLALVAIMGAVLFTGYATARLAGQGKYYGLIAGGATAICGASAALAIYAVIGKDRLEYHRFTFTLVGISLASAIAMSVYPILASRLGFSDVQAGFLTGAAIHDVAQSLGGGFSVSPAAGEVATIVKLTRVTLLAPVVALIGLMIGRAGTSRSGWKARLRLPWFIAAFFAVVALNSLVAMPGEVKDVGLVLSKALLLFAVIAAAMRSRLDALLSEGVRGLAPVIAASLMSFALAFLFAWQGLG